VLYGSDALGGVINVITRSPEYFSGKPKVGGRGKLKYMNKGMEKSGLGELSFQSGNFALLGNVGYKDFGDIFAGGDLGFERPSGYDELSINLNAKIRLGSTWQLKPAFQYVKQNEVPRFDQVAQRGYQTYLFDPQIHRLAYAKLEHFGENPLLRKIQFTVSNQYSDETRKLQKSGSLLFQEENDQVTTYGISAEVSSEISPNWEAVTGVEFYTDQVESGRTETNLKTNLETEMRGLYPNDSDMRNLALFSQHTLKLDNFNFTFGGRFNTFRIHSVDNEFGEVTLTPNSLVGNLSAQYFVSPKHQFIASAYSAFRAPNINDISSFGLFDYGIEIPSTDLSPEKSFMVEGGYKQSAERFSMAFSVFNNRLKNQIVREKTTFNGNSTIDGEQVYKKQNLAKSNIMGVEFESGWQLTRQFSFINNLTWLQGKNLENDKPIRRIPPLNGKLALQYNKSGIFGEAEFLFAAKQDRLSGGDIDDHRIPDGGTPGWNILNLKAGYAWKTVSLNTGLQNIFNKAYRIHGSGVDGYGRSFWISLQFNV
jgi:outer membrane receptor protein involved in Fe transport